jgi:hypothetical protein
METIQIGKVICYNKTLQKLPMLVEGDLHVLPGPESGQPGWCALSTKVFAAAKKHSEYADKVTEEKSEACKATGLGNQHDSVVDSAMVSELAEKQATVDALREEIAELMQANKVLRTAKDGGPEQAPDLRFEKFVGMLDKMTEPQLAEMVKALTGGANRLRYKNVKKDKVVFKVQEILSALVK